MGKKTGKILFFIIFIILLLVWVVGNVFARYTMAPATGAISPYAGIWTSILEKFKFNNNSTSATQSPQKRVKELEIKLHEQMLQLAQQKDLLEKHNQLLKLLDFPVNAGWKVEFAAVTGREPFTWYHQFRIDKGSKNGIVKGAAVVADGSIIGRIKEVTSTTAMVMTLADPSCKIGVSLNGIQEVGILQGYKLEKGYKEPDCLINYLPMGKDYKADTLVYTSGLGSAIPGGIPVARTITWPGEKVVELENNIYAKVRCKPLTDYTKVKYIGILIQQHSEAE